MFTVVHIDLSFYSIHSIRYNNSSHTPNGPKSIHFIIRITTHQTYHTVKACDGRVEFGIGIDNLGAVVEALNPCGKSERDEID